MDPASRLLRLLSLLQSRPLVPAGELAERLGVGPRTVRRDVARLRDLGYPVHTTPGEAGYTLGAGARLPPLLLDDDEAVAIAIGLRMSAMSAVAGVEPAAVAALAKIDQVLPTQVRERVRSLESSTVHLRAAIEETIDPDTLVSLATACRRSERVKATYRTHGGDVRERRLDPLQIVQTGRRWYLVARDCDADAWRTFRVDRLEALELTGHLFEWTTPPPDAAAMVAEGTALAPWSIEARLLLDLTVEEAKRQFEPFAGVVEEEPSADGRAVLRVGSNNLDSLVRFAAGLTIGWEVEGPGDLRKAVRRYARAVLRGHTDR